jgi:hypothetical protein
MFRNMVDDFLKFLMICQKPAALPRHIAINKGQNAPLQSSRRNNMKTNARFIKSVTKTAADTDVALPWTRGARRAAFIAQRKEAVAPRKAA